MQKDISICKDCDYIVVDLDEEISSLQEVYSYQEIKEDKDYIGTQVASSGFKYKEINYISTTLNDKDNFVYSNESSLLPPNFVPPKKDLNQEFKNYLEILNMTDDEFNISYRGGLLLPGEIARVKKNYAKKFMHGIKFYKIYI